MVSKMKEYDNFSPAHDELNAQLIDAIENMRDGFAIYSTDERLIYCNSLYRNFYPSIANMLTPGARLEDLTRTAYEAGAIQGSAANIEARIDQRLTRYRTAEGTHEQQLNDGRWLLCSDRRTPTGCIACTRTDITEVKKVEEALRDAHDNLEQRVNERTQELLESQANFTDAARFAKLGHWRMDLVSKKYISVSETYAEIFGYTVEEFLARYGSLEQDADLVHPDDLARVLKAYEVYEKVDVDYRILHRDGGVRYVREIVQNIFEKDGRRTESVGTLQDITEQKLAEEELQDSHALYRQAESMGNMGHWSWDTEGEKMISCSDGLARILDMTVPEVLNYFVGIEAEINLIHPDDKKRYRQALLDTVKAGKGMDIEYRIITLSGIKRHIYLRSETVCKDDGTRLRTFGTVQDITERKRIQDQLRQSQKMEAVGQLTGGIAHDFNNIIGIIVGSLELLQAQIPDNEKASKWMVNIDIATRRAADLVRQLLDFSRQQATDIVVSEINQIISKMDSLIRRSITPEVEINQQFAESLWLTEIDPGNFQDTLLNLVLNARDAMPDGGRLTIKTCNCTLDAAYCSPHPNLVAGEYVKISVSDTGTGMTAEQQEKIYEPFYTTKPAGKGTGLGLSMVFGFITRSHGHIEVESEPGRSTTFHLYLPRATERRLARSIVDHQSEALPRGSETILAVDDEVELLELARETLEILGYRVLTASNGKEAMERLAEHPTISLLFSDIVMPGGMNGYELAQQAMEQCSGLSVLLTSGHAEKAREKAGLQTNLLRKPYTHAELAQRVRSLLNESKTASI